MPDLTPRPSESSPSSEFRKAQQQVMKYRELIREHPEMLKSYADLAQVYLQEARVSGRHHLYIPIARHLLDEALRRDPNNFEALITKSSMLMTLHQFAEAKALAVRALAQFPRNAFAYGLLCDANVELGNYDDAVRASDSMNALRPDLRSYARASYLRELHGDIAGAEEAMFLAIRAGVQGQEDRAWAMYNLGNLYLNQGKLDTAEYIYKAILEERPNYGFALSGLASISNARSNHTEAIERLVKASQLSSEHIFIEQLADIYTAIGEKQSADAMNTKVIETFRQHEEGGWNIDREYAMFCANHGIDLQEAVKRAKREYERRPNNIDALDTYAWALHRSGESAEAIPFIERAMQLGTKRSELHYHAGMIYNAVGRRDRATAQLEIALKENPFLNVLYRDSARETLASMKHLALAR
jgi:tetratricopeptide (TPR) repeat protein